VRYEIASRRHPSDILSELAWHADPVPTLLDLLSIGTSGPTKRFVARIGDSTFKIYIKPSWRVWETFFTPVCRGRIEPLPTGSRIALTIRPRLGGLLKFAGVTTAVLILPLLVLLHALSMQVLDEAVMVAGAAIVGCIGTITAVIMWQMGRAATQREALVRLFESISSESQSVWSRSA